ncbi:MAG: tetratricopeptide repeat protein [Candidatus Uhrbacteria bacterium]
MKLPKLSIRNIIFILAVLVLLVAGLVWRLEKNSPKLFSGEPESPNLTLYADRGLSAEMQTSLEQKVSDLEALMASDEKVKADVSQWLQLGNFKYQLGDLAGAKEDYEHILTINPQDAPAHENLAQAFYEMGDFVSAESHWRAALAASPWEVTYIKLVNLIDEKFPARHAEVQTILEEAIATLGQMPVLLVRLGDWYLSEGDYSRALSHYQIAKQLEPTDQGIEQKITEAKEKRVASQGD